jgi:hypothetical protein
MKHQTLSLVAVAVAATALSACGGHSDTSMAMGGSSSSSSSSGGSSSGGTMGAMMVNTRDVLTIAQQPSETALPFAVDAGYTFTDTSETTQPITVGSP